MIRRPPRSTLSSSSAASDVYKRQYQRRVRERLVARMAVITVDVFCDLACPWCYVGKNRFEDALRTLDKNVSVQIRWHPYIIDAGTAESGEDFEEYCTRRWGNSAWTKDLRRAGRECGADFADWRWWPHTLTAHR
eukprot:TRINITY_DN3308_c0_g2_i5.p1 TRINITY_DN3308_c0_g2~~TRINITY_DN3308_c0_g2_i5.p1  ORF type:complete len:135 (+),score=24.36 TRINITY_DN3308_c0_g2_i5:67-471(+)